MSFYRTVAALTFAILAAACTTSVEESTESKSETSDRDQTREGESDENIASTAQGLTASGGGCPCRLPACWPYCRVADPVYSTSP